VLIFFKVINGPDEGISFPLGTDKEFVGRIDRFRVWMDGQDVDLEITQVSEAENPTLGCGVKWHFPKVKTKNDVKAQVDKIAEELNEVFLAGFNKGLIDVAYEAWDVIQATETLLRMLRKEGVDVGVIREKVMQRNAERGRYEEE